MGAGYDATDWQNSLIEREPSVAEILEAFAANPPNFDDLINSVANAQTLAEAQAEIELLRAENERLKVGNALDLKAYEIAGNAYFDADEAQAKIERLDQCIGELRLELSKCQERNDELCIANHNQTVKISKIRKVINEN